MHPIEKQLIELGKLKARDYPNRQDQLAAIVRAVEKAPDAAYATITDPAEKWYNDAARAINDQNEITDFDDYDFEEFQKQVDKLVEAQGEADEADEDDADDDVNEGSVEEAADDSDEDVGEAEVKAAPAKKPKTGGRPKKAEKAAASDDEAPPKPKQSVKDKYKTPYDKLSGKKDRYGIYEGTNTSKAVQLYEKGSTVRQVTEVLGGKYRNILKQLAENGHRVEKLEGGVYKVTHKDDVAKKGKK